MIPSLSRALMCQIFNIRIVCPLLMLLCAPSAWADVPPALDAYIMNAMREWRVPGLALVIVKNDTIVAARGYGVRELGRPEPVDGKTIFDIASLTKSFTAAGAATLVDAGVLEWDDRVVDRLPAAAFAESCLTQEITLRDLLAHRTGLRPANSLLHFFRYDRSELLGRVRFLPVQGSFRGSMIYSNILYMVAGELTAAAAGSSWAALIQKRLLGPAGMGSTIVDALPTGSNVATPHAFLNGVQQPIQRFDYRMVGPASSIYTNAEDLARWLRLHLGDGMLDGKQILSRASVEEMHSPQNIIITTREQRRARMVEHFGAYGLGWQIMDYQGHPIHWHTGNADGMPSYMAMLPQESLGVAVILNTWGAGTLHLALGSKVIDTYLDLPERDWSGELLVKHTQALAEEITHRKELKERLKAAKKPFRALAAYAGTYEADLWGAIHVRLEGKKLLLQLGEGATGELAPWDNDAFLVLWDDPVDREFFYESVATFAADPSGRVNRFSVKLNRDTVEAIRK